VLHGAQRPLRAASLHGFQAISQPWLVWLIALPFLVGTSLWLWHISENTRNWKSNRWSYALLFTPLIGAISFAIDVLIGGSNGHYKTFLESAAHAGSPFGFPLTVLICPVGTLIAFGSWIRCVILHVSEDQLNQSWTGANPEVTREEGR
jgi:hypothetical protein